MSAATQAICPESDAVPLPDFLALEVPAAIREITHWSRDRLAQEAEAAADVIAGGADALFANPGKRDTVNAREARAALARGLAILALRPCGVDFAGLTWTAGRVAGGWLIPDEVLSRHERGAFFTPREVAETITAGALDPLTREQPAERIAQLRIVDIACGAGAFLLAAARYLAAALVAAWERDGVTEDVLDDWGLDDVQLVARETVLDSCIHGVDLDPLSVELARVAVQLLLPHTDRPPDARRQIKRGDALLGQVHPGWHDDARYPAGVSRFDWHREYPHVFLTGCDAADGGFDAVIGNPPYLGGQKITGTLGKEYREYLVNVLAEGQRGSADLAAYFWIRAAELCSDLGTIGLITTNTLLQGRTAKVGRGQVEELGWQLYSTDSMRWPGAGAAVECVLVWCHRLRWIPAQFRGPMPWGERPQPALDEAWKAHMAAIDRRDACGHCKALPEESCAPDCPPVALAFSARQRLGKGLRPDLRDRGWTKPMTDRIKNLVTEADHA